MIEIDQILAMRDKNGEAIHGQYETVKIQINPNQVSVIRPLLPHTGYEGDIWQVSVGHTHLWTNEWSVREIDKALQRPRHIQF